MVITIRVLILYSIRYGYDGSCNQHCVCSVAAYYTLVLLMVMDGDVQGMFLGSYVYIFLHLGENWT